MSDNNQPRFPWWLQLILITIGIAIGNEISQALGIRP